MINLQWGTQKNGRIDETLLIDVSGRGDYMEPTGAAQFKRMQSAIRRDIGFDLQPAPGSSAYRPEQIQIDFFTERYTKVGYNTGLWWNGSYWTKRPGVSVAAIPGTSNHGWARAIDLNISQRDEEAWAWMLAHAAEYGFSWATGKASGEDWHWESLTAPGIVVASDGAASLITKRPNEEDGMFIKAQGSKSYIYDGWCYQMAPDGKIQALSQEQVGLAKSEGHEFATWSAQDIYNHSVKAGLWEFTGKAGGTDPGYLTGLLLFGDAPGGGYVKKLPGQQYR